VLSRLRDMVRKDSGHLHGLRRHAWNSAQGSFRHALETYRGRKIYNFSGGTRVGAALQSVHTLDGKRKAVVLLGALASAGVTYLFVRNDD